MIKVVGVILIDTYDKSQIDDLDEKYDSWLLKIELQIKCLFMKFF